jgi:glycosyltransferase involved in cell wall biosynthesis
VGGIPEVVAEGETALLIEPEQCELLADAACKLLDDPIARQRMGEAGRKRWRDCFTYESMVDKVEAVLSKIVAEKKRHEPA